LYGGILNYRFVLKGVFENAWNSVRKEKTDVLLIFAHGSQDGFWLGGQNANGEKEDSNKISIEDISKLDVIKVDLLILAMCKTVVYEYCGLEKDSLAEAFKDKIANSDKDSTSMVIASEGTMYMEKDEYLYSVADTDFLYYLKNVGIQRGYTYGWLALRSNYSEPICDVVNIDIDVSGTVFLDRHNKKNNPENAITVGKLLEYVFESYPTVIQYK